MDEISKNNLVVKNPMDDISSIQQNDDVRNKFVTIVQFIHHYGRVEFRMQPNRISDTHDIWNTVKKFLN